MRRGLLSLVLAAVLITGLQAEPAEAAKWIHRQGKTTLNELFQKELRFATKKRKNVLVMFTADWCAPCKAIKQLMDESKVVQRYIRKGHVLLIDVDKWRGPAHRLIPGSVPKQLPLLVSVDRYGKRVVQARGSMLGLLSEEETGKNLARMISGKSPLRPAYLDDPKKKRELLRAQAARDKKRALIKNPVQVKVLARWPAGPNRWRWMLKITIHNTDAARRYFALAMEPGQKLKPYPQVGSYEKVKFTEHVRANYFKFYGSPELAVFPVAGRGSITLNAWSTSSPKTANTLDVWALHYMRINKLQVPFEKKVTYALSIQAANDTKVLRTFNGPHKVFLNAAKRLTIPLER